MKPLTESQEEVLRFLKTYRQETGSSPSYREIQRHFRYKSVKAVQDHIQALIAKGAIEAPSPKAKRRARTLMPAGEKAQAVRGVPIYGEIAAGSPRDNPQLELGTVFIPQAQSRKECFGLRVTGDSMVEAGIFEGDTLVVEKCERARHGEIIVALLDGETTVKRYREQGGEVFLVPENARLKPIATAGRKLEIQGKVIGLQRRYG